MASGGLEPGLQVWEELEGGKEGGREAGGWMECTVGT